MPNPLKLFAPTAYFMLSLQRHSNCTAKRRAIESALCFIQARARLFQQQDDSDYADLLEMGLSALKYSETITS